MIAVVNLCPEPNCESCNGVRRMLEKTRAHAGKQATGQADAAQAPTDKPATGSGFRPDPQCPEKAPGSHVPKVFAVQKLLTDSAKGHRQYAEAMEALSTALPGLPAGAIEGVFQLCKTVAGE